MPKRLAVTTIKCCSPHTGKPHTHFVMSKSIIYINISLICKNGTGYAGIIPAPNIPCHLALPVTKWGHFLGFIYSNYDIALNGYYILLISLLRFLCVFTINLNFALINVNIQFIIFPNLPRFQTKEQYHLQTLTELFFSIFRSNFKHMLAFYRSVQHTQPIKRECVVALCAWRLY